MQIRNRPKTVNIVIIVSLVGILYYVAGIIVANFMGNLVTLEFVRAGASIVFAIMIGVVFSLRATWSVKAFNIASAVLAVLTVIVAAQDFVAPRVVLDNADQIRGYSVGILFINAAYLAALFQATKMVNRSKIVTYFEDPNAPLEGENIEDIFQ